MADTPLDVKCGRCGYIRKDIVRDDHDPPHAALVVTDTCINCERSGEFGSESHYDAQGNYISPDWKEEQNKPARRKANYVGAPAIFALELACRQINEAFSGYGCYLVGSALERPDWRDVDIRCIMGDDAFEMLFPNAGQHWEWDARWLLLTTAISERLSKVSGLPVDFQIQPQTHANERHKGPRHAIGLVIRMGGHHL